MTRAALILAGGAGTRLQPLSSEENPKQFLPLFDGRSLIQLTYARVAQIVDPANIFVSTNDRYRDKTLEHLPALPPDNVITEPSRRNTAPALALACFTIAAKLGEETAIACLASDHYIGDEPAFLGVLERAYEFAETNEYLMTISITPAEPNTEYGYLELGAALEPGVLRVVRFVEKPDRERAEEFVRLGYFTWNAGMFVWRNSVFRHELAAHAPDIALVTRDAYGEARAISIDYALMEKAAHVATVRGEFGWSDVGSFEALEKVGVKGALKCGNRLQPVPERAEARSHVRHDSKIRAAFSHRIFFSASSPRFSARKSATFFFGETTPGDGQSVPHSALSATSARRGK
ncbi:MAG: mannose-1-phosphate guanylyltransferase [Acidobacteria bacterium]|nr:mannose-1-phosphate guanylyltransferase [Acidobacteriota bacterium]